MPKSQFVHLHVHSEYSLLDGFGSPKNIVKRAKELGMEAIALTDHGAMYGVVEFYKAAKAEGVNPIIGVEAYITNQDYRIKGKDKKVDTNHLTLLAKNEEGYRNLMRLTTIAHLEGYYYRPKFDKETLKKYFKGIVCASGCIQGEVAQYLAVGEYNQARQTAAWFQELFGNDYYLELQRHEYKRYVGNAPNDSIKESLRQMAEKEESVEQGLLKLSRELAVPIVATNDSHYIAPDDAQAQDALVCVATGKLVADTNRIRYIDTPNFYIRSQEEMAQLFADIPEALENPQKVAKKCNLEISTLGKWYFPNFKLKKGETANKRLKKEVYKKARARYKKIDKEVKERINYELEIITKKGYSTYFLIVADIVEWANKEGIITNTRGSVAGSLVSYILGISTVDPLKYNLPFERFLNPYRPTPPDIDLDFDDHRREEVIDYLTRKYGKGKVAQICTFGRMLSRAAVRDVARVLGYPYATGDRIAKVIPPPRQGFPINIPKAMNMSSELKQLYETDEDSKKILSLAEKLEGSVRHVSVHAAGVVISPEKITNFTPLQLEPSGDKVITQYEMNSCEDIGLIKLDILGISNLSILGASRDTVFKNRGISVDLANLPLDDKKTYAMLGRGETMGVFQMGSPGMTRYIKELKPTRVEDLMAMVALYRPGPMAVIPEYIARKHNSSLVKYLDPRMKSFLDKSYGLIIYQDDLLFCAIELAGYTWEEADKFRKAVGKKIPSEMAAQKGKFTKGIVENGQTEAFAETLWQLFEPFQAYGFNKAHAASYGIVAYQTAYMKANYPVEFMTAFLTSESSSAEKLAVGVSEAKRLGIKVFSPDINKSRVGFEIEKLKESLDALSIRFGLSAIKNVGEAAVTTILAQREEGGHFISLYDFCLRVDSRKVNKRVLESLIKAGAMDDFGSRAALLASMDSVREQAAKFSNVSQNGQESLFGGLRPEKEEALKTSKIVADIEDFSQEEKLSFEKELLGLYLSEHPLTSKLADINGKITHKLFQISTLETDGQAVRIGGIISGQRIVITKKSGQEMSFATLEDDTGEVEMVIFPSVFAKYKSLFSQKEPLIVEGKVENREETYSVLVDHIYTLQEKQDLGKDGSVAKEELTLLIPKGTNSQKLVSINRLLQENPGEDELTIVIENSNTPKRIKLPYGVSWTKTLAKEINEVCSTE